MDKLKFMAWVDTIKELFDETNDTPFTNTELQSIYKQVISDMSVQAIWNDRLDGAVDCAIISYVHHFVEPNSDGVMTEDLTGRQKETLDQELRVLRVKFTVLSMLEGVMVALERNGNQLPPELRVSMSLMAVRFLFMACSNLREKAVDEKQDESQTLH